MKFGIYSNMRLFIYLFLMARLLIAKVSGASPLTLTSVDDLPGPAKQIMIVEYTKANPQLDLRMLFSILVSNPLLLDPISRSRDIRVYHLIPDVINRCLQQDNLELLERILDLHHLVDWSGYDRRPLQFIMKLEVLGRLLDSIQSLGDRVSQKGTQLISKYLHTSLQKEMLDKGKLLVAQKRITFRVVEWLSETGEARRLQEFLNSLSSVNWLTPDVWMMVFVTASFRGRMNVLEVFNNPAMQVDIKSSALRDAVYVSALMGRIDFFILFENLIRTRMDASMEEAIRKAYRVAHWMEHDVCLNFLIRMPNMDVPPVLDNPTALDSEIKELYEWCFKLGEIFPIYRLSRSFSFEENARLLKDPQGQLLEMAFQTPRIPFLQKMFRLREKYQVPFQTGGAILEEHIRLAIKHDQLFSLQKLLGYAKFNPEHSYKSLSQHLVFAIDSRSESTALWLLNKVPHLDEETVTGLLKKASELNLGRVVEQLIPRLDSPDTALRTLLDASRLSADESVVTILYGDEKTTAKLTYQYLFLAATATLSRRVLIILLEKAKSIGTVEEFVHFLKQYIVRVQISSLVEAVMETQNLVPDAAYPSLFIEAAGRDSSEVLDIVVSNDRIMKIPVKDIESYFRLFVNQKHDSAAALIIDTQKIRQQLDRTIFKSILLEAVHLRLARLTGTLLDHCLNDIPTQDANDAFRSASQDASRESVLLALLQHWRFRQKLTTETISDAFKSISGWKNQVILDSFLSIGQFVRALPPDLLERQFKTLINDHHSELYKLFIIRNNVMAKVFESHQRDMNHCQDTHSCIPKYHAQPEHSGAMFSETLAQLQHHRFTI